MATTLVFFLLIHYGIFSLVCVWKPHYYFIESFPILLLHSRHRRNIIPTTTTTIPIATSRTSTLLLTRRRGPPWGTTTTRRRNHRHTATTTSTDNNSSIVRPKVSTVNVCTADLCCCQEEDNNGHQVMGGDEIVAYLQSCNLSYDVDETPCLGACGGGAMVAIDYDDGTSILVTGIDETLYELGLSSSSEILLPSPPKQQQQDNVETTSNNNNSNNDDMELLEPVSSVSTTLKVDELESTGTATTSISSVSQTTNQDQEKQQKQQVADARDRMRAQAQKLKDDKQQVVINPWLTTASYLAEKAVTSLLGTKKK